MSHVTVNAADRSIVTFKEHNNSQAIVPHHQGQTPQDGGKCDYLPDDILLSLTHRGASGEHVLPPPVKLKSKLGKPASVWNYPERREKFRHLTQSTACICGAGKDISFLYDVPPQEDVKLKPTEKDPSAIRVRSRDRRKQKSEFNLPDTLIPDEFHLVKSKGVIGLEFQEEKFATNASDHEKHLTVFPSLQPTSRYEVLKLKETMEHMLKQAGVDDYADLETTPSQMHALLALVKKEQDIYNVIFHELIRQTTVECLERGELLANLRQRYSNLLSKIPEQVKSLHNEVVAQRALDRRLTEELLRFKTTITILTNELSEVKKHEENVSKEVRASKEEMKKAMDDAKRNADLLNEYHSLYELQRHRLEDQVGRLSEEREMWSTAAYCLAMKVTEEYRLTTASRLHVAQKSWSSLARHFTVLLTDVDTTALSQLQALVSEWRDHAENFDTQLLQREQQTLRTLDSLKTAMREFGENFQEECLSDDGHLVAVPNIEDVFQTIYKWEKMVSGEAESFGGDVMLNMQETLSKMRRLVNRWSEAAIKIFHRHAPQSSTPVAPIQPGDEADSHLANVQEMSLMNKEAEELMRQWNTRLTGDNGVAQAVLTLQTILESWHTRLAAVIHGQSKAFPETEWSRLYSLLPDWSQLLDEARVLVGRVEKEEDLKSGTSRRIVDVKATLIETQKWASVTTAAMDSENSRRMALATQLHTETIHWMIQVLLRIAPHHPSSTPEGRMNGLLASASVSELKQVAESLFERVQDFTTSLAGACSLVVSEITQAKMDRHEEDADVEANEMRRFLEESREWVTAANLLLNELLTGEVAMEPQSTVPASAPAAIISIKEDLLRQGTGISEGGESVAETRNLASREKNMERVGTPRQVEGLGSDGNTHPRMLEQSEEAPPPVVSEELEQVQPTVHTPNTERAYEALAAMQSLQAQLKTTESRAEAAEKDAMEARLQLNSSEDLVKSLEQKLASLQRDMDALIKEQKEQDPLPNLLFRPVSQQTLNKEKSSVEKSSTKTPTDSQKSTRQQGSRKGPR